MRRPPPLRRALALTALLLLLVPALAAAGSEGGDERLVYRWRLLGFIGVLSGLFFPADGEGELTSRQLPDGHRINELLITSRASETADYFRYGAELDPASGRTLRAWSSQRWRGKPKDKASAIDASGVVDIASAIALLRRDRPAAARQLEIWSDGHLYPIVVRPEAVEVRTVLGHKVSARRYAVRPVEIAGRRVWKGELDLWLAEDAVATPVEILVARPPARVRLEIVGLGSALLHSPPP